MPELHVLRYAYLMLRMRLLTAHDDERGVSTLEIILWTAGLAVIALGAIVVVTAKVTTAGNNIPTGPSGP